MVITNVRFAFIQVESLADPLAARKPPDIPFAFLLNQAAYEAALADAIQAKGPRLLPWYNDAGKLFWYYYLERKSEFDVTFKEAWRGLVPLHEPSAGTASAPWLDASSVDIRQYLYPWGLGVVIDVHVRGKWSLEEVVELGLEVRASGKYDWDANGKAVSVTLNALMNEVIGALRAKAYGPKPPASQAVEMFSIVTVLDAEKAKADVPVADQSKHHRALDALVSWSPQWKTKKLDKIQERSIETKSALAAPGHVLYGGRRGRVVWFPGSFPSSGPTESEGLRCYHQNLAASALQTESLCALTASAAARLAAGQSLGAQSVSYKNCAQLAAGILGRLHGGDKTTYRSHTLRDHIRRTYLTEVNAVRKAFTMSDL